MPSQSLELGKEIGHEVMLACAVGTLLLSRSARDGVITQPALAETVELTPLPPGVQPLAAFALWLVSRFLADVAPETAGRWLAHSDRIVAAIDSQLWPERVLRDETLAVLGITDLVPLLESTPPLDHATAHAQASAWVAGRSAAEIATRTPSRTLSAGRHVGGELPLEPTVQSMDGPSVLPLGGLRSSGSLDHAATDRHRQGPSGSRQWSKDA